MTLDEYIDVWQRIATLWGQPVDREQILISWDLADWLQQAPYAAGLDAVGELADVHDGRFRPSPQQVHRQIRHVLARQAERARSSAALPQVTGVSQVEQDRINRRGVELCRQVIRRTRADGVVPSAGEIARMQAAIPDEPDETPSTGRISDLIGRAWPDDSPSKAPHVPSNGRSTSSPIPGTPRTKGPLKTARERSDGMSPMDGHQPGKGQT